MNPHLAPLLVLSVAALPVVAQQTTALPRVATPIHTAPADEGIAYGTWAAGERYKVSFHEGMTFVPYLGFDYPVTRSWHWRTASVRLGEVELLDGTAPHIATTDWRCEYRFGAVTEAYDVRLDGLEQTFVLDHRPAAGDLVIRGEVSGNLRADDVAPDCQALIFRDEGGRAIVEYGRGTAVDAVGRRCAVTTECRDGAITLTVPGEWLGAAALPIVVDPLIATLLGFMPFNSNDVFDMDIGRDDVAAVDTLAYVYSIGASANDADLVVMLARNDWSNWVQVFTDITSTWSSRHGRCAFVGGSSRWVIAMERYFPNVPSVSRVRVHSRASGDTTLQTAVASLGVGSNENHWRPDVGGVEGLAAGDAALIVFQSENNGGSDFANSSTSRVGGVLFDTLTQTFGPTLAIASSPFVDNEFPSVNQVAEGGAAFAWMCAYQRYSNPLPNDAWDIAVLRIEQDGTIAPGFWTSDLAAASQPKHQLEPFVEGAAGRYAVTFSTADATSYPGKLADSKGDTTVVERFDWYAGGSPTTAETPVVLRTALTRSLRATGLAHDTVTRSHWVATSRFALANSVTLHCDLVGFHGQPVQSPYFASSTTSPLAGGSVVFDNDVRVYRGLHASPSSTLLFYGNTTSYAGASPPTLYGTACGTGTLQWTGSQHIGDEFSGLSITGAPTGALHLLVLGDASISVPLLVPGVVGPNCTLQVPISGTGFLGIFPLAIGANATWALPLPESLFSMTLQFQDWYLDPADSLLWNSARLQVPVTR